MINKTRSAIPLLLVILIVLFAAARLSIAQDSATTQGSTSQGQCECWIDVKTGKRVPTVPLSGININPDVPAGVAVISGDRMTAFNPKTGQNFAHEPDGCWIDVKTGKRAATVPLSGININPDVPAGVAVISGDRQTAFNPRTKQNFAREPCPPPAPAPTPEKKKEACDLEFGYDYLRAPDESAKSLNGFGGSLFCNVKPWIAIGGDFGALFGSTTDTIGTTKIDVSLHRQTYLFGPQFNFYPNDKVKVFVHPLFGGVHDSTKISIGTVTSDFSANAFAMSFGGGVDVNLNHRFAVRPIQIDYLPTRFGGAWQSNYQISTGLVIHLGEKK